MAIIDQYLQACVDKGASDLHIASQAPVYLRVLGELKPLTHTPLSDETCEEMIFDMLGPDLGEKLRREWEIDTSYTLENGERFRVNAFRQRKGWDAVFRHFHSKIRNIQELGLPPILRKFGDANQGLILITGPGRCGKSTTSAALLDYLNESSHEHIITIEDPIEFIHAKKNCLINQRAVGEQTATFASALRSALREDPDIIMVGELRDTETMSLALTAAETGHLVIGTLHTRSAATTISRVVNLFPPAEQAQATISFADCLVGILSQRLIPSMDKTTLVPAFEILVNNVALSNTILEGDFHKIPSVLATGQKEGMATMDASLRTLVKDKKISQVQADEILAEEG